MPQESLRLELNARVNRIVNIVVGIIHILVLIGTQFVGEGETWNYWRLYELLEVLFPSSSLRRRARESPAGAGPR